MTIAREIPYNYTSADDRRIVSLLLGEGAWEILERLRDRRVTGRSARLLMRVIGELFVLERNPFVQESLIGDPGRRRNWLRVCRSDLERVAAGAGPNREVLDLVALVERQVESWKERLEEAPRRRRELKKRLEPVVGDGHVCFDPYTLVAHATDATDWRLFLPEAVVFPDREDQVPLVLRILRDLGYRVIPRGGGTGLTGGAVPTARGCVVVNVERLNRIHGISEVRAADGRPVPTLTLEAGVITEEAIRYAEKEGWVFATDPTSAWACTIGGNIAENAGGKKAVLWGTAVDNLVAFRIAMPDGVLREVRRLNLIPRRIREDDTVVFGVFEPDGTRSQVIRLTGREIRKPGLGKDITNKALGGVPGLQKEGVDGIITAAQFLLHRPYPECATYCLEFFGDSMDEASEVIAWLVGEFVDRPGAVLMALEHFDEEYVKAIEYRVKAPRADRPKAVLLLDLVARNAEELKAGEVRLQAGLAAWRSVYFARAVNRGEAEEFWSDRKRLGAIAARTNAFKLNEDIVLPVRALAAFARFVEARNAEEERRNQQELVTGLEGLVAGFVRERPSGTEGRERLRQLLAFLATVRGDLDRADCSDLAEGALLANLRDSLARWLEGFPGLARAAEELWERTRARRITIATHMHAGDGNVHVNIPVFSNDLEMLQRAFQAADDVMAEAVRLGGVVSGEHGIGFTKFKYLEAERIAELERYRDRVDPERLMNPGKLSDPKIPELVFTPSFNLIELEARILRYGRLEALAHRIAQCVRCGRCKRDCCMFYPGGGLFFHPRNKNLAVAAVVEAVLYETQRVHATEFEGLRYLAPIAEHCTLCGRCLAPCPVKIDTAQVTLLEREILATQGVAEKPTLSRWTLAFLGQRSETANRLLRPILLQLGTRVQRRLSPRPVNGGGSRFPRLGLPPGPLPLPSAGDLRRRLPQCGPRQALWFRSPAESEAPAVLYFPGCGSERLFAEIGEAALYLLRRAGFSIVVPPPYLCCGFPHLANADLETAKRLELLNMVVFSQIREMFRFLRFTACAFTCGTCREQLGELTELFEAPARDVAALCVPRLAGDGKGGGARGDRLSYVYHPPCHDSLEGGGAELIATTLGGPCSVSEHCCSQAGTLALTSPRLAAAMGAKKRTTLEQEARTAGNRTRWLTNCPSCLQGLGRLLGTEFECRHLVQELAERWGGARWRDELDELLADYEVVTF
ncbi:MAG: FAD-binding and (Fe-S)-binding domain-containing protein [Acidobacteriota bacterium]